MQLPGTKGRLSGPIRSPGSGVRDARIPVAHLARCLRGARAPSGCLARGFGLFRRARVPPTLPVGSGDAGMSPGGGMSPMRWRGGRAGHRARGCSCQPPSWTARWWARQSRARFARSVGPPWSQWRRWWASHQAQGSGAVGEDTAAVADGQGAALGGLDDPGGPSDLQGLGGGAAQGRGQQGHGGLEPARQPVGPVRVVGFWVVPQRSGRGVAGGAWPPGSWPGWWWPGGWRVTRTRVTAPSQASRRQASGSSGPAQPTSPPTAWGWPSRLSRSTITLSCGRTPPVWGSRPPSRGGGPTRPGHQRCVGCRSGCRGRRLGGPTVPGRPADSGRPRAPTAHPPPPCRQRSGPATTPGGHDAAPDRDRRRRGRRPGAGGPVSRRSRPGSSCRAASTSTGSASTVTWSGRCWVPAASTWAWATDSSPSHTAWAVWVSGPRNRARAVRTALAGRPVAQVQPVAEPGRGRA